MKGLKGSLPNILTFINLSLGVIAILLSVNEGHDRYFLILASLVIMVAALTDRFDGHVARMLGATSELGKELDSLSDLISFGVAPIIIAWKISFSHLGIPGYLITLAFPIAGAYRLARYNVTTFDKAYVGLPITIAGAFLTIDNLYNCFAATNHRYTTVHSIVTAVIIIVFSYLMVSKVRIKKV